jgi:hypothetical protein
VTRFVVIVKVVEVNPEATVTLAGTVAFALLEFRLTASPPDGAGPFKVTVPVALRPPIRLDGDTETPARVGGVIENVPMTVTPL